MGSVSISVSPVPPKEFSKKKRSNRLAKLKQCKMDVRREQWLSQVKAKEFKAESNENGRSPAAFLQKSKMEEKGASRNDRNLLSSTNCHVLGYNESMSSNSSSCWSSSEEEDCLDDWEAMADALTAQEDKSLGHQAENEARVTSIHTTTETKKVTLITRCQAWSANDALRPQSLPSLSNTRGSELNSCCPICCEDLDGTDSSFEPCTCGFQLCLFCHKRILEVDSRCPGCRKHYN